MHGCARKNCTARTFQALFYAWLGGALGFLGVGTFSPFAVAAETANETAPWQVTVLDANPQFADGISLPLSNGETSDTANSAASRRRALAALGKSAAARVGAVTDGHSILLLRVATSRPGRISWRLPNGENMGRLGDVSAWQGATATVSTTPGETPGQHIAWALYQAPPEFGPTERGEIVDGFLVRQIELTARFTASVNAKNTPDEAETHRLSLILAPPPVVLVHGTYHSPKLGWQMAAEAPLGEKSFEERTRAAGLQAFQCDYEATNGAARGGPSRLADNQRVIWENRGGIRAALQTVREQRHLAATQVDVVGHSQGGLLARAYALGKPLPQPPSIANEPAAQSRPDHADKDWYHRPDNYEAGDIRRLITLCTPHFGSDLPRLLLHYGDAWSEPEMPQAPAGQDPVKPQGNRPEAKALLQLIDMMYGMTTGAFQDQSPGSAALAAIGATKIPAHAIACTAESEHFAQFNSQYRWSFLTMYLLTPPEVLERLFKHEGVNQPLHAQVLVEFLRAQPQLQQGLFAKAWRAFMFGGETTDSALDKEYNQALELICAAVFGNQPRDGAVRLESALGGLPEKHCTVMPGVLHSFAPRYTKVQDRLLELLLGPADNFSTDGFPPAGRKLRNLKPDEKFDVDQFFQTQK